MQHTPLLAYDKSPKCVDAVDLGLPSGILWATCNIGAKKPEEGDAYLAWGETEEKKNYDEEHYRYYHLTTDEAVSLGKNISGTQHDAARLRWGKKWRMPTVSEFRELVECCSHE